jgi:phenylpropionate dioxygenase-like ring-hydroxylating dioxygenase large terminal subunit
MSESDYQLSKCVPDMQNHGFTIQTNYGLIFVNPDDPECQKIIDIVVSLLDSRS